MKSEETNVHCNSIIPQILLIAVRLSCICIKHYRVSTYSVLTRNLQQLILIISGRRYAELLKY